MTFKKAQSLIGQRVEIKSTRNIGRVYMFDSKLRGGFEFWVLLNNGLRVAANDDDIRVIKEKG